MKTKLLLLIVVLFSFAFSCEKEEVQTNDCNCKKTYYVYYPAMGNGPSYIPARYEVTGVEYGNFDCESETGQYVEYYTNTTTHYKIECD